MRGIISREKRNMCVITLLFTAVVCFLAVSVIPADISANGTQLSSFFGEMYDNYGNLFLGTIDGYYTSMTVFLMIAISFVAVMQYRESNISKSGEFLMQLPVKRGRIFAVRTLIGMMTYTIPWLLFSFASIMMRLNAQSWYEMKLVGCANGRLLLGNDSIFHLCVYLVFMWISFTEIYAIAAFFQNICNRPWIAGAIGIGTMLLPNYLDNIIPKMNLYPFSQMDIYHGWWMAALFGKGAVSEVQIFDKGVHQTVNFSVFDHFTHVLLIQIILIVVFLGVSYYVFKKADIAKRNQFMYFSWMEHVFVLAFSFCIVLFIVIYGFRMQSLAAMIISAVATVVVYYIVEKRKKRRAK